MFLDQQSMSLSQSSPHYLEIFFCFLSTRPEQHLPFTPDLGKVTILGPSSERVKITFTYGHQHLCNQVKLGGHLDIQTMI